jgi:hypothetical protein
MDQRKGMPRTRLRTDLTLTSTHCTLEVDRSPTGWKRRGVTVDGELTATGGSAPAARLLNAASAAAAAKRESP